MSIKFDVPHIELLTPEEEASLEGASQAEIMAFVNQPRIRVRVYKQLSEIFSRGDSEPPMANTKH